jgi:DNA-binding XRE family transcriptional regulator
MSKVNTVARSLPPLAKNALRQLGENIAIARSRRKESQRAWAERIGVSVPTLIRLEKGDPTVSMAAYASALWLMGRAQALSEIASNRNALAFKR